MAHFKKNILLYKTTVFTFKMTDHYENHISVEEKKCYHTGHPLPLFSNKTSELKFPPE